MWQVQNLENLTECALAKIGQKGDDLFANYRVARKNIVEDILPQIKGVQPDLTDHGPDHVADVLNNAEKLVAGYNFTPVELYCLLMIILFHDVGNIYQRKDHQKHVAEIYDFIRKGIDNDRNEKFIIMKAAEAHCGSSIDGSKDTLKDVAEIVHFKKEAVRLRELAAVLRFADELAEGRHRTSQFMTQACKFNTDSQIFHEYASMTDVNIDKNLNRIALTYNIEVNDSTECELLRIDGLLNIIYQRIIKLDQERRYTKHYSEALHQFKETAAILRFWNNIGLLDLELEQVVLTDLIVPGEKTEDFSQRFPAYSIQEIRNRISQKFKAEKV